MARGTAERRRLEAVLDQAPTGLVVVEAPSGRVVAGNRRATEILGGEVAALRSAEEYPSYYVCLDAAGRPIPAEAWPLVRALRGEVVVDEEVEFGRVGGVLRRLHVSATPIRDDEGRVESAVVGFVDVSERARTEQRLKDAVGRFRSLVDSVDGIVWEADASFRFEFVSNQAERLLGYPVERWLEEGFWAAHVHPADRDEAVTFCTERTARHEAHDFEYRMIAADGREVWLRDIVTVVAEEGRPVRLRGLMVDITATKALEADRERLLVHERLARSQAEEALRLRDEFLSVAAHELRTPIAALRLRVEMIERGVVRDLPAEGVGDSAVLRLVRGFGTSLARLQRLVDHVLDVSVIRREGVVLHRKEVDLSSLVRGVLATFGPQFESAGCRVTARIPDHVVGQWDPWRLEQVVLHLLSNASKFGHGAAVEVELSADEREARLVVRDHGIGIAPDDQRRLFAPFGRAVSPTHFGGLGFGLYVTRTIVEAHGGNVRVDSAPGTGATFVVTLPREAPERDDGTA